MGRDNRERNLGYFFDHALKRVPDKIAMHATSSTRLLNKKLDSRETIESS